jgi:hypothetical protein
MSIKLPKPLSGMYILGNDHTWTCQVEWGENIPATPVDDLNLCSFEFKLKEHAADDDDAALLLLDSTNNADQFMITDLATGTFVFWLKSEDQETLEANRSYYVEMILTMGDGKIRTYIKDNLKFTQGL